MGFVQEYIVHVNRLKWRSQPNSKVGNNNQEALKQWNPPLVDHSIVPVDNQVDTTARRYPTRNRRPPDRYGQ